MKNNRYVEERIKRTTAKRIFVTVFKDVAQVTLLKLFVKTS